MGTRAAACTGGATDRGREAAPGLPDAAVYGLAADGTGSVYAAVRGARAFRLDADGGWRDVTPGLEDAKGYGIGVTPGGSVLLATSEGVVRSADQGATWSTTAAGLASSHRLRLRLRRQHRLRRDRQPVSTVRSMTG